MQHADFCSLQQTISSQQKIGSWQTRILFASKLVVTTKLIKLGSRNRILLATPQNSDLANGFCLPHHKLGACKLGFSCLQPKIFWSPQNSDFSCNKFFWSLPTNLNFFLQQILLVTTYKLEFLLATIFYKNRILLLPKKILIL